MLIFLAAQAGRAEERFIKRDVPSRFLSPARTVRICLPESYFQESTRRYPVLYLHDGQNVFSSAGTNICFGWGNWELDKTTDQLSREGKLQQIIMVAVDNSAARYSEYCGRHRSVGTNDATDFENYASFLIKELKPLWNVRQRQKRRLILGRRFTTAEEVDFVAHRVVESVRKLRQLSPAYRTTTEGIPHERS